MTEGSGPGRPLPELLILMHLSLRPGIVRGKVGAVVPATELRALGLPGLGGVSLFSSKIMAAAGLHKFCSFRGAN